MSTMISAGAMRQALRAFDFKTLMIENLGWDHIRGSLVVEAADREYQLEAVAQKRGVVLYLCDPGDGGAIPDANTRALIDREVGKAKHEHILVFVDAAHEDQVWYWVRRHPGQPLARRSHRYNITQPGDALIQKLSALAFSIDEEATLGLTDVLGRIPQAFDVDRVTKRFYDRFRAEQQAFLGFVRGIESVDHRTWYSSVMLNRLMFTYFIQKKGFLDGDRNYFRNRMEMVRKLRGSGQFLTFYRHFLLRLFHEGLGDRNRNPELDKLLGVVPYLNGGLFELHELEQLYPAIEIPDEAFGGLFDFFDSYQWHLDERPLKADNEINPDVLGFIFEKYINQKEMGAYYSREDITGFITASTAVPRVLELARERCEIAFRPDGPLWRLLSEQPSRYVPQEMLAGIGPIAGRGSGRLPGETLNEHAVRATAIGSLIETIGSGRITNSKDLVGLNLDIRQFAQDAIDNAEGSETVLAFYEALRSIRIVDPACGSGAFLFAALNILEPLVEACVDRMESFVADADAAGHHDSYVEFRRTLQDASTHPSRRYFVLKGIILANLFGVDIIEEAVEICRLRLFLKLIAQLDSPSQIEPLPDLDFNVRAGNSLVGLCRAADIATATSGSLDFTDVRDSTVMRARKAGEAFVAFTSIQEAGDADLVGVRAAKKELGERLAGLRTELNRALALRYGVNVADATSLRAWEAKHQPFHWITEFYPIMAEGGFDVVVGNPPYIEYAKSSKSYTLLPEFEAYRTNLFAAFIFRATQIKRAGAYISFVVPVSLPSTDRMEPVRHLLLDKHDVLHVSFSTRPSKLFDGAEQRLTIFVQLPGDGQGHRLRSGGYRKWHGIERPHLFASVRFVAAPPMEERNGIWPKLGDEQQAEIFTAIRKQRTLEESRMLGKGAVLYYKNTGLRYFNTVTLEAPRCWINGKPASSSRETLLGVLPRYRHAVHCLLLSSLFFFYYTAASNCRDLNPADIRSFPVPDCTDVLPQLEQLSLQLEADYRAKGKIIRMNNKLTGLVELESLSPAKSKPLIDEVDRLLAPLYRLTPNQAEYIIALDSKYRVGDSEEED
jgi:Eco57I restriction-modification methylase